MVYSKKTRHSEFNNLAIKIFSSIIFLKVHKGKYCDSYKKYQIFLIFDHFFSFLPIMSLILDIFLDYFYSLYYLS